MAGLVTTATNKMPSLRLYSSISIDIYSYKIVMVQVSLQWVAFTPERLYSLRWSSCG